VASRDKFDSYRLRVERDAMRVRLITRGGYDWTKRFSVDCRGSAKKTGSERVSASIGVVRSRCSAITESQIARRTKFFPRFHRLCRRYERTERLGEAVDAAIPGSMPNCCGMLPDTLWRPVESIQGRFRLWWAIAQLRTRLSTRR